MLVRRENMLEGIFLVKSNEELERLKRAAGTTDEIMEDLFEGLKVG